MAPPLLGAGTALLLALSGNGSTPAENSARPSFLTRRAALSSIFPSAAAAATAATAAAPSSAAAASDDNRALKKPTSFRRYPQLRFIAALGDPESSSGYGSDGWGLWRDDPGPRGVYLRDYESRIVSRGGVAPAGWTFVNDDWWLEEHGLIMSNPDYLPRKRYDKDAGNVVPYKRYVVTGDREVTTVLTVHEDGRWELAKGTLYDVTHLPCRSARYTIPGGEALASASACAPTSADRSLFPVKPGAAMPPVAGCAKQDYAVLFVLGEEV